MSRLYTFGCSFTRYYWPTWADMLGQSYDHFENWGNSGLGNRAILERLTECIVHNNISKDDTVIIQWSEFHRFDFHLPLPHLPEGWAQGGNLLTSSSIPNDIMKVWNEKSYIMHTLNFINAAARLLDSLGCKWYMTSIRNLHFDAAEYPEFMHYCNVFYRDNFLTPIGEFLKDYEFPKKEIFDNKRNIVDTDEHPIPIAYHAWLNEILVPCLKVDIDQKWCESANDILMDKCHSMSTVDQQYVDYLKWSRETNWVRGVIDSNYAIKHII
jgi:hypothetical protein